MGTPVRDFASPTPPPGAPTTTTTATVSRTLVDVHGGTANTSTVPGRGPDLRRLFGSHAATAAIRAGFVVCRVGHGRSFGHRRARRRSVAAAGRPRYPRGVVTLLVNESRTAQRLVPHALGRRGDDAADLLERAGFQVDVVETPSRPPRPLACGAAADGARRRWGAR